MPPSPTLAIRDRRILAGHAAGVTILDLAVAEEVDPAVVRPVLPRGVRPAPSAFVNCCWPLIHWLTSTGLEQIALATAYAFTPSFSTFALSTCCSGIARPIWLSIASAT